MMATSQPTGVVSLKVLGKESYQFHNKAVDEEQLKDILSFQMRWHRLWKKEPQLILRVPASTPTVVVQEIIRKARSFGFEGFSLRVEE